MEVWLLAAMALVLIGITVWIVWPGHTTDAVENSTQEKEVQERSMSETGNGRPVMPLPQGDRFEDQYTSATADLSAGGVASAVEAMQEEAATSPGEPSSESRLPTGVSGGQPWSAPASGAQPWSAPASGGQPWTSPGDSYGGGPAPRTIGVGAGVALALAGGIGGAWLYARWVRERNKPINRLRRSAREMGSRLGERMPDVDDLPQATAPMSGAAAAILLSGLILNRVLSRSHSRSDEASAAIQDALEHGRREAPRRGRKAVEYAVEALELAREVAEARARRAARRGRDAADDGRDLAEQAGHQASKRGREVLASGWEAIEHGRDAAEAGRREATKRGRKAAKRGREQAEHLADRLPSDELLELAERGKASGAGKLGLGALSAVGAGLFLVWRLARRPSPPKPWYAAE